MADTHKYLIIGGSTKCGTTSVFKYFEYHPQVCPCVMKESRYFWMDAYALTAAPRNYDQTTEFSSLFRDCGAEQIRIEATPDYLYSTDSAKKIHNELPGSKMVFVLRHPVNRLISWYNFARVNGLISSQTTFETYILTQQNTTDTNKPQHLRALEQGLYSSFAEQYLNIFGKNAVLIVFYEDLVSNPKQFCSDIAGFAGIDENYFRNFDFKIFNKTVPAKSVNAHQLFRKIKRAIRPVTRIFNASIRKKLKLAGHNLESRFQDANKNEDLSDVSLSADMLQYLENFYKSDKIKLQQLTGKIVPW